MTEGTLRCWSGSRNRSFRNFRVFAIHQSELTKQEEQMAIVNGPIPQLSLNAPGYGAMFAVNPHRGPVRPIEFGLYPPNEFQSQLLYSSESVWVLASRVPPHGAGPKRHTHAVDQWLYSLKGKLKVSIADKVYDMAPGTIVNSPAACPHFNWNETDEEEIHLEVMMPGIPPTAPTMYWEPEKTGEPKSGTVIRIAEDKWESPEKLPGFATQWLFNPQMGFKHGIVYVAHSQPGAGFTRMHVHLFDQLYFVQEGTLKITMGYDTFEAGPNSLVVIPARVPHFNVNAGPGIERHVAMNVPAPMTGPSNPENPWDRPVEFRVLDEFLA